MIKKKNHKNLKIAMATGVSLFSLLASFTAVYAWFAMNKKVDSSGLSITAKENGSCFSSLTVHRCNKSGSNESVLKFYSSEATSGSTDPTTSLNLPYYDDLTTTEPVLLLFELNEHTVANSVTVEVNATANSMTTEITSANHSVFPFSSAVYFKACAYSIGSNETFPFDNIAVSDLGSKKAFVTMTNGVCTGFNPDLTLYSSAATTEITHIAVVMDYYQEALSYIFSNNLGTNLDLTFKCDFTLSI